MKQSNNEFLVRLSELSRNPAMVNLGIGQPEFSPPDCMIKALHESIGKNTGYTPVQGIPELREQIKKKLRSENKVKAESVLVTAGAVEALFNSMLAFLKTRDEVILFSPHYSKYNTVPELLGARVKRIGLRNKRPDLEQLEKSVSEKTKIIVLNSPCNPTGMVFSREEIKKLVEIAEKNNSILLSDEVYEKFVYDGKKHTSPGEFSENVITINSFSKSFGFPGLRLGYLAGRNELVMKARDIHLSNVTCVPEFSQSAALAALKCGNSFKLASFEERRNIVLELLNSAGAEFIHPEGTFYIYVFTKGNAERITEELMKEKILVMPNTVFAGERNALRISYAIPEEKLENSIKLVLEKLR